MPKNPNMARVISPDQRAEQAEAIREWAPWKKSTGPQTSEGKEKVSRNAYAGGTSRHMKELAQALKRSRETVADVRARAWQEFDGVTRK